MRSRKYIPDRSHKSGVLILTPFRWRVKYNHCLHNVISAKSLALSDILFSNLQCYISNNCTIVGSSLKGIQVDQNVVIYVINQFSTIRRFMSSTVLLHYDNRALSSHELLIFYFPSYFTSSLIQANLRFRISWRRMKIYSENRALSHRSAVYPA